MNLSLRRALRLVLCLGLALAPLAAPSAQAKDRLPAPAWTMNDLDGKPVSLSDYRGKIVLLNFWATWCPPCRMEIPDLIALQKEFGPRGLHVIGASLDEGGPEVVRSFAKSNNLNYQLLMSPQPVSEKYLGEQMGIPTSVLIDGKGNVVTLTLGVLDKKKFAKLIDGLLPPAAK
jgi:thiol-disulfide isomerase/thioredoxin